MTSHLQKRSCTQQIFNSIFFQLQSTRVSILNQGIKCIGIDSFHLDLFLSGFTHIASKHHSKIIWHCTENQPNVLAAYGYLSRGWDSHVSSSGYHITQLFLFQVVLYFMESFLSMVYSNEPLLSSADIHFFRMLWIFLSHGRE